MGTGGMGRSVGIGDEDEGFAGKLVSLIGGALTL